MKMATLRTVCSNKKTFSKAAEKKIPLEKYAKVLFGNCATRKVVSEDLACIMWFSAEPVFCYLLEYPLIPLN
jgi:hypothetical protein